MVVSLVLLTGALALSEQDIDCLCGHDFTPTLEMISAEYAESDELRIEHEVFYFELSEYLDIDDVVQEVTAFVEEQNRGYLQKDGIDMDVRGGISCNAAENDILLDEHVLNSIPNCTNIFGHRWRLLRSDFVGSYHLCNQCSTFIPVRTCFDSWIIYEACTRTFCNVIAVGSLRFWYTCPPKCC
jgi:hypothetical protein